jgi:hypothetical protein
MESVSGGFVDTLVGFMGVGWVSDAANPLSSPSSGSGHRRKGVDWFEDLEMGPVVKVPSCCALYSVSSHVKQVFKITIEEILNYLSEFMNTSKLNKFSADEFLDFIGKKRKVDGRDKLSVRIQNFGSLMRQKFIQMDFI